MLLHSLSRHLDKSTGVRFDKEAMRVWIFWGYAVKVVVPAQPAITRNTAVVAICLQVFSNTFKSAT